MESFMETKNHYNLSVYLSDNMNVEEIKKHIIFFILGNFLPDINPVSCIRGHTYQNTYKFNESIGKGDSTRIYYSLITN